MRAHGRQQSRRRAPCTGLAGSYIAAMPRSMILTCGGTFAAAAALALSRNTMFSALMSRWITPLPCMYASASASCAHILSLLPERAPGAAFQNNFCQSLLVPGGQLTHVRCLWLGAWRPCLRSRSAASVLLPCPHAAHGTLHAEHAPAACSACGARSCAARLGEEDGRLLLRVVLPRHLLQLVQQVAPAQPLLRLSLPEVSMCHCLKS